VYVKKLKEYNSVFYRAELWSIDKLELIAIIEANSRDTLRNRAMQAQERLKEYRELSSWNVFKIVNYPYKKIDLLPFRIVD
jgi:hypothetical protein